LGYGSLPECLLYHLVMKKSILPFYELSFFRI
jgi:hypothetical protein